MVGGGVAADGFAAAPESFGFVEAGSVFGGMEFTVTGVPGIVRLLRSRGALSVTAPRPSFRNEGRYVRPTRC